jgi:N-methylhydantoinase B
MIATNVRHPRDFQGDLAATIGSARVGERRPLALLEEYGEPTVGPAIHAILDGAERQARACISQWKDESTAARRSSTTTATRSGTSTCGRR